MDYYDYQPVEKPDWLLTFEYEEAQKANDVRLRKQYRDLGIEIEPGSSEEYEVTQAYVAECEAEATKTGLGLRLVESELIKRLKMAKKGIQNG